MQEMDKFITTQFQMKGNQDKSIQLIEELSSEEAAIKKIAQTIQRNVIDGFKKANIGIERNEVIDAKNIEVWNNLKVWIEDQIKASSAEELSINENHLTQL
jgi:hypothetical protein